MWESRVLCEISKRLWKSFCDFHSRVISIAASIFVSHLLVAAPGGYQTLGALAIVVPTVSYAVGLAFDRRSTPILGFTSPMLVACACDSFFPWS
jgi:hypothetical protein